ncbi:MAG TPA: manganese transporter [Planctomycetaceae bacterium]|nr:manganese transporter [Planctomycetaceae bacterium]
MLVGNSRAVSFLFCLLLIGGCGQWSRTDEQSAASAHQTVIRPIEVETIQAVATVGMVGDLVRNIGGSHVQVRQLMGPGVDPHLYKITRDDVRAIFAADIIFASGLMLEGKMAHTLEQMARRRPVIAVADHLAKNDLLPTLVTAAEDESSSHYDTVDPHVWMDLGTWSKALPFIADALSKLKPSAADEFHQRAEDFEQQLLGMHQYGLDSIATIPPSSRHLITSHDAFGYFGQAYGLQVTGVQGISTDSEAGLLWINQLVDTIVTERIRAVFVENSVPRKSLEAVIEGVQSRGQKIIIGGELFSDSAGPVDSYEGTYLGMMDHNLTSITRALGGSAPPRGLRGQLERVTPLPQNSTPIMESTK